MMIKTHNFEGEFFCYYVFMDFIQHCIICRPSEFVVSEDCYDFGIDCHQKL